MVMQSVQRQTRILVVDDEPDLRTLYELTLVREGYLVESAGTVDDAWQVLERQAFDLVITDMRLPDGLGLDLLRRLRADHRQERCVVITAYGSAQNAVDSLKAGAFDYLTKPVDLKLFRSLIASATLPIEMSGDVPFEVKQTKAPFPEAHVTESGQEAARLALEALVGSSLPMVQVRDRICKVAKSMAPVLIRGESGTGKELAARALHANSHRWQGPLIAVNCSAIPENLLETEFFGAKKGAFTGATSDRPGYFQSASGGTLFLDEIGDLPLGMQAKLLRAVQERCVRPVGGIGEEPVNVRIVSATHKDLAHGVKVGEFRQDLYYRLNVIEVVMPSLRERPEDLPALCEALLKRITADSPSAVPTMSEGFLRQLLAAPLNGNVRELENHLHRAVALSDGNILHGEMAQINEYETSPLTVLTTMMGALSSQMSNTEPAVPSARATTLSPAIPSDLQEHLDREERQVLMTTLQNCDFNRTLAASKLGLSLRQIRYRMARLRIEVPLADGMGAADTNDDST